MPGDLLKTQNAAEWKRAIIAAYNQDAGKTSRIDTNIYSSLLIVGLESFVSVI